MIQIEHEKIRRAHNHMFMKLRFDIKHSTINYYFAYMPNCSCLLHMHTS